MHYELEPDENVKAEIAKGHLNVDALVKEALRYMNERDVDDVSLARMFIEQGCTEDVAYWLVREAEVRNAPR